MPTRPREIREVEPMSGSRLQRQFKCPGSMALVRIREETTHSSVGRLKHRYMELLALGKSPEEAAEEINYKKAIKLETKEFVDALHKGTPEATFVYDPETGEVYEGGTRERVEEREILAIIDWVRIDNSGPPVVMDYKFGKTAIAADSPQMMLSALVVARSSNSDEVISVVAHCPDNEFTFYRKQFNQNHLSTFESKLKWLYGVWKEFANGIAPKEFHEGEHCYFCPGKWVCPAKTTAMKSLLAYIDLAEMMKMGKEVTPEIAAALAGPVTNGIKTLEKIKKDITMYIDETGPLKTPEGYTAKTVIGAYGKPYLKVVK